MDGVDVAVGFVEELGIFQVVELIHVVDRVSQVEVFRLVAQRPLQVALFIQRIQFLQRACQQVGLAALSCQLLVGVQVVEGGVRGLEPFEGFGHAGIR